MVEERVDPKITIISNDKKKIILIILSLLDDVFLAIVHHLVLFHNDKFGSCILIIR